MQEVVFRREVEARGHREILIHTGQHYDEKMSQVFFKELGIPFPNMNLNIGSGSHGKQTGRMLEALDDLIVQFSPHVLVVDGDTNSTLAGALSAVKQHIPLVHIEAGLRSFDRRMPEEINRVVSDHIADLLCAPTNTAVANLKNEGLTANVVLTGDLMYDCFLHFRQLASFRILENLGLKKNEFLLATVHRAENTDDPKRFAEIIDGLCRLPVPVVLPAHPRIKKDISCYIKSISNGANLKVVDPIGYLEMLALELTAQCILTDSGGVQREAFFAGKPSVILRDTTEWKEQVESGWSLLAGADADAIEHGYHSMVNRRNCERPAVYGDGRAASKVVSAIEERFE